MMNFELEVPSIQDIICNSIQECDIETRADFYKNIVLSGGNTLFEGMVERLAKEIEAKAPKSAEV
jgi:actin, other eukaryote